MSVALFSKCISPMSLCPVLMSLDLYLQRALLTLPHACSAWLALTLPKISLPNTQLLLWLQHHSGSQHLWHSICLLHWQ